MDKIMEKKWKNRDKDACDRISLSADPSTRHTISSVPAQTDRFRTPQPFSVSEKTSVQKTDPGRYLRQGQKFGNYVILKRLSPTQSNPAFLITPENNTLLPENPDTAVLKLYPAPDDPEKFLSVMKKLKDLSTSQNESTKITPEILSSGIDENGYCWYISRYVELPSLESFIQAKAPLKEHKALYTIYTIAALLNKNCATWGPHGRLTPSKILFGLKKQPLFPGMGLNSFLQQNKEKMLPDEKLFYASPEYISDGTVSQLSDIYSLGIIFFRLLSGVLPFYSPDVRKLKEEHLTGIMPSLSGKNPAVHVSSPTVGIINRMTMKDPARRFSSMEKLLEALIQADDALPPEEKD